MASAQVLSNSSSSAAGAGAAASSSARKQGHLEAGKKRLEEFRKKKAAKKAAALTEQAAPAVPDLTEKLPPNASGANSTDGPASDVESSAASTTSAPSGVYQNGPLSSARSAEFSNDPTALKEPVGVSNIGGQVRDALTDERTNLYGSLSFSNLANGHHENWIGDGACRGKEYSSDKDDQSLTSTLRAYGNNNSSKFPSFIEVLPNWHKNSLSSQTHDTQQSRPSFLSSPFEKSESTYSQDYSGNSDILGQFRATTSKGSSQMEHSVHTGSLEDGSTFSNSRGERMVDLIDRDANVETNHQNVSDSTSANFDKQDPFPSTSYPSMYSRSRPSFLDSIGVQRAPPTSQATYNEPAKVNPALTSSNSKFESASYQQPNQLFAGSNTVEHSLRSGSQEANDEKESSANSIPPNSVSSNNEQTLKHGNETFHNFTTHGKDDDFTALEQLIEDLTQEKFSLQRTLEKSQALAQNLATDNSALTDKFNQQAQVISQLTSDMERLQGEIQAQLLALESVKMEYANAQLECNAADERAKVLAAEVILLEDKALRLRSNELKLGKEVEDLKSEISSYRRKVSSLEKDRQHFQSTIDALQEEKKLLQSKLRNLPVTEKVNIPEKHPVDKRDASTATEDLDTGESSSSGALLGTINTSEDAGTTSSMSNDIAGISSFEEVPSRIPNDQLRMIDNINSLMSELSVEREELLRALRIESSNCSNLKELNKDLTQKLEIQTNRLELLTAQRMASENALAKPIDMPSINDATIYADEGDEVVERVLGWIMKLFPGGPKRRTSKLL